MDVRWVALILLGAIGTGRTHAAEKIQVAVYVQPNNWPRSGGATGLMVSKIFSRIDVDVAWHGKRMPTVCPVEGRCIGIRTEDVAPAATPTSTLAVARPFGTAGSLITVYQDRVEQFLRTYPSVSHNLVAYIFVHELAHVMQGNDHHSVDGILKAHWSLQDIEAISNGRFNFAEGDMDRIRRGLCAAAPHLGGQMAK
jgi:hypothetical protein